MLSRKQLYKVSSQPVERPPAQDVAQLKNKCCNYPPDMRARARFTDNCFHLPRLYGEREDGPTMRWYVMFLEGNQEEQNA